MKLAMQVMKLKLGFFLFCTSINMTVFLPIKTENKNQENLQKQHLVNYIVAHPVVSPGIWSILYHQSVTPNMPSHSPFPTTYFYTTSFPFQGHIHTMIICNLLQQNNNIGVRQERGKDGTSIHTLRLPQLYLRGEWKTRRVVRELFVPLSLFSAVAKVSEGVSK